METSQENEKCEPISCNVCSKSFVAQIKLNTHMKTVHSKLRKFKCEQCDKLFSSPALVRRHIMGVHEKIKDFACITY